MASAHTDAHSYQNYQNIHLEDSSRAHLGNIYNYGQSLDERAFGAILESLRYPGMTDRRDALAEAYEGTFDWTLLEGKTEFVSHRDVGQSGEYRDSVNRVEMNFSSWLRGETGGLFCFTGKPGAGKSTFMKALASSGDVEKLAQCWTKDNILLRADHWFWILGGPMQKSLEGLLRSLLHSMLSTFSRVEDSRCYAAVKEVCGSRWTSMDSRAPWNRRELKRTLTHLTSVARIRCIFLIDALDECEPQDALSELADEILWMSRLPNVKLCVSCRPWSVFVRKFDHSTTLNIDLLTYCDIAKYIEERLVHAEAQCDFHDDFCSGTQAAKKFVYGVADAAGGVFLWIELVTKALCSELRKGRSISQLHQIVREFPTDIDGYFDKLIFDRIGKTRTNIRDTAAALKLAMEIHRVNENDKTALQYTRSFMNFWLLCRGHLRRGFSWKDYESIVQCSLERMAREVASFLEETCKDLLGPVKLEFWQEPEDQEINFLHRTVYDFLSDSAINVRLERDAPEHFSDPGFITELGKLRCLCLIRLEDFDCFQIRVVFNLILGVCPHLSNENWFARWMTACESLVITQMHRKCQTSCLGLDHLSEPDTTRLCVQAGLSTYLREAMKHSPHSAIIKDQHSEDVLAVSLTPWRCISIFQDTCIGSLPIAREALECGCDPNSLTSRDEYSCGRTYWEVWLAQAYWHLQTLTGKSIEEIEKQKCEIAAIISLLLSYGADPHCTLCVTHDEAISSRASKKQLTNCRRITLTSLLPQIVPPESLGKIARLQAACSDEATISILRRNQSRRAIRSLVDSERNLLHRVTDVWPHVPHDRPLVARRELTERQWQRREWQVLTALTCQSYVFCDARALPLFNAECLFCSRASVDKILLTWCVDCRSIAYLCRKCCEVHSSQPQNFEPHCRASWSSRETMVSSHTSIIVACDALVGDPFKDCDDKKDAEDENEEVDSLASRYDVAQAIIVLKEWYAQNPI